LSVLGCSTISRLLKQLLDKHARSWNSQSSISFVRGTPTMFIDGVVHRGSYDAPTLLRRWRDERSLHAPRRPTIGREYLNGDLDLRAGPHRGRISRPAHDGQLGPRPVQ